MSSLLRSHKELLGCSAEQICAHASILHYPALENTQGRNSTFFFPVIISHVINLIYSIQFSMGDLLRRSLSFRSAGQEPCFEVCVQDREHGR
jgi:hypothetical protein